MKNKIKSIYHEENGITLVSLRNKYGTFWAGSCPADADLDIANKWTGGRLAEYKCQIQMLKKKYQIMNQRAIGVENAVQNIKDRPNTLSKDDIKMIKLFERQAYTARREADNVKKLYKFMEKNYLKFAEREVQSKRTITKEFLKDIVEQELSKPAE